MTAFRGMKSPLPAPLLNFVDSPPPPAPRPPPRSLRRADAAEADVRGGAGRLALAAGAGDVADAVVLAAQEGAAALHPLGHPRFGGVEAARGAERVTLRAGAVV